MAMPDLDDQVLELIIAVGRDEVLPRFRALRPEQVRDKGAGELVTDADEAAERVLSQGLRRLLPGSLVVGEEGSHREPELLDEVARHECVWLVDPIDGTRHFATGRASFGTMVALLRHGSIEAAWIHLPVSGRTAQGRRGQGVVLDGKPARIPRPPPIERMLGAVKTRFMPPALRRRVQARSWLGDEELIDCPAAPLYLDILAGVAHFALYYRTEPWDHAPGALLIQQAGGAALRLDGSPYLPGDGQRGLLVAPDLSSWRELQARLL